MVKPALSDSKTCLLSPILGVGKLWATGQFWPTSLKCFLHFKWLNTTKRRIFHEGWKLYKIQVSTSIKAVLLEHSHDHSLVVCDYFCTLRAGLSNCTWDLVACQAWNINSLQKNFSTPALYHAASEHRIVWKKNKCTWIDWMGYFLILSILVSQGCHNKVPLTGWLNRNVFFLQFWKPEAEIKVLVRLVPSENSEAESVIGLSLGFCLQPAVLGILWLIDASLQLCFTWNSSCASVSSCDHLLIRTKVILD